MDFTTKDIYFHIIPMFILGCSFWAVKKAIKPVDRAYRKLAGRNKYRRRRRLSDLTKRQSKATMNNLQSSYFLGKLPLEIRQMIYALYYENSTFVVGREGTLPSKYVAWLHDKDSRYLREDPCLDRMYVQRGVLGLPLTCRQMYSESISYIYSIPTFACYGFKDAFELPKVLLPQRWQALTKFHFWFNVRRLAKSRNPPYILSSNRMLAWKDFWRKIAAIPHLHRLETHLGMKDELRVWRDRDPSAYQDFCDRILQPLLSIPNIAESEIWITNRPANVDKYVSAPFRLSWHEEGRVMHLDPNGDHVLCDRGNNGIKECCALRF